MASLVRLWFSLFREASFCNVTSFAEEITRSILEETFVGLMICYASEALRCLACKALAKILTIYIEIVRLLLIAFNLSLLIFCSFSSQSEHVCFIKR